MKVVAINGSPRRTANARAGVRFCPYWNGRGSKHRHQLGAYLRGQPRLRACGRKRTACAIETA